MRTYTHYPHAFSVSIFPYFIKCRQFIVAVYFSFSIIKSNLLKLPDFNDISISQQLLNSVYVGNAGEPSVRFFFLGSFVGFFWISNFVFMLYITTSSLVLLLFTSSFVRFYTSLHELMMNCFCGMVDRRKAFSLISSRDHCQRSLPSQIWVQA